MSSIREIEDCEYWKLIPDFLESSIFEELLEEITPLVGSYGGIIYKKPFTAKRLSCKFTDINHAKELKQTTSNVPAGGSYDNVKLKDWSESPLVKNIREYIEEYFNEKFDYCLLHLYRNCLDTIGWHCDNEARNTSVVSLSFGETRKFRFRKKYIDGKKNTTGYEKEYHLQSGDLLYMKDECQRMYKHIVPVEKTVTKPRINLTFRKFDTRAKN